jgi:phospholipid transport system substrate-binding protein
MKRRSPLCLAFFAFLLAPALSFAGSALDTVKTNVNVVLEVLRDPGLKGEKGLKAKREKIETLGLKFFDFAELSKRTLGLSWNQFTLEQRKTFLQLYQSLLEDTYLDRITAYSDEKLTFLKETRLSDTTAEVFTTVLARSGEVAISYRLTRKDGTWRVYDVVIEGVSLINNYRSQFREVLANGSPQTLIDSLQKKVARK